MRTRAWVMAVAVAAQLAGSGSLLAQQPAGGARRLSLDEALRTAERQSEQVQVAEAGVLRARGQKLQARSEWFPQLSGQLSYTRALASEFEGAFGGGNRDSTAGPPPCPPFAADPSLPLEQRVSQLEAQHGCASSPFAGLDLSNLPFGRENTYRFGLALSQNLFAGGRLAAQNRVASAAQRTAEIALRQARAQLALDVSQAYYDALLSERLFAIAEATLQQAETTLGQARLAHQVGNQPEFELLRAQVTRDNQQPVVIQRRSERDLSVLRLKQLLDLPADQPLELTSELGDDQVAPAAQLAARMVADQAALDSVALRAVVRQAQEAVEVQENLLDVSRSQRLPALVLTSQYGRVAYPTGAFPELDETRANWTVGVALSVPILTGGRIRGDQLIARANLMEAQARLQQVRELAGLDARSAYEQLASALAAWRASQGTVEQAQRAYTIAEVRYREGVSTQVELSDARILFQQAQANRASAARNLQLARTRVSLLPDLPLGAGGAAGQPAAAGQQAPAQQAPRRQAPRQQAADASFMGF